MEVMFALKEGYSKNITKINLSPMDKKSIILHHEFYSK